MTDGMNERKKNDAAPTCDKPCNTGRPESDCDLPCVLPVGHVGHCTCGSWDYDNRDRTGNGTVEPQ